MHNLPEKVSILIARLSYNGLERVEIANWLAQTVIALHEHPRVANVFHKPLMGYPTPLVRNQALTLCRAKRIDFLVMIDDDMVPDLHSPNRAVSYGSHSDDPVRAAVMTDPYPVMRDQQNFFPSALDFALEHPGPCVIGAPYCAGPPEERVLVSRFREKRGDDPSIASGGLMLECFTRDEAATRTGFEMVSALPTGLILIDVRCTELLKPPYFGYEYKTDHQTDLASTEDTVFSRNCMYLNVPQYCAWSSWAGHVKTRIVGRPRKYPISAVPLTVETAVRERIAQEERERRPPDVANPKALAYLSLADAGDDAPVIPLGEEEIEPEPPRVGPTIYADHCEEMGALLKANPIKGELQPCAEGFCANPNGCDDAKACKKQGRCDGD